MICISYQVHDGNQTAFLQAMEKLGKSRRRDGAWEWNIMEDITAPGMFQEFFLVATWLDHLRQHERISKQDAMIQDEILSLLEEGSEPDITHFIKTTRE
jgi:hypothetical protein